MLFRDILSHLRILLVEDNPGDARLLQEMLKDEGSRDENIFWANSLQAAFERLDQHPVDLVMLDLNLPDSRGGETFAAFHQRHVSLPVIILSGMENETIALQAMRQGAQDYLVKGQIEGELLKRSLAYAVERNKMEQRQRQARLAAEEANRTKSQFLAKMSHEIRTPMNAVLGMLDLTLDTPMPAEQRESLEVARSAAHSLLHLLNDLLDFSRLEGGKLVLRERPFRLSEMIFKGLGAFKHATQKKKIDLSINFGKGVPDEVVGDPERLGQVLVNLVSNAVKFTDRGRVTVGVRALDESSADDATLEFEVSDTGIGIDPAHRDQLFTGFFQVDGGFTRRHGGAGLGLSICHELVQKMGGSIEFESTPNQGSRFFFTVRLRRCAPGTVAVEQDVKEDPPANKNATGGRQPAAFQVLVAEDNPLNQMVARRLLEKQGYRVVLAGNGQLALDFWETGEFDLILMDIQMPVLDGLSAIRAIRLRESETGRNKTPIVAVTAHALEEDARLCLEAGADYYVSKPIGARELENICWQELQSTI